jgi:hypothetical protein
VHEDFPAVIHNVKLALVGERRRQCVDVSF